MSDSFEMLVDPEVSSADAEAISLRVVDLMRREGLITGELNEECVLGGAGYQPGPRVPSIYKLDGQEHPFWKSRTCGVEPRVGPGFNEFAIGPACEGFSCPSCGAVISHNSSDRDKFGDRLGRSIGAWYEGSATAVLACTRCNSPGLLTSWQFKPPLGLGELAFVFWNWPPLTWDSWTLNVPQLVQDVTGHEIVRTWGRI